jgi:hypothetical protein
MGGTPDVSYPAPTAEERALQAKQLALLEQQEATQKEWEPILLQSMGYARGDEGLTKLSPEEYYASLSPYEQLSYDIATEASERELKALRGELEVDPAVEREIEEGWLETQERMSRQLGPGWEVSTPGIQASAEQKQRAAELRDAVRRGEMTTSEAVAASRSGRLEEEKVRLASQAEALSSQHGSLAGLYETPKSWYERYRLGQFQSKQAKATLEAEKMRGISQGISSGMGMVGGMFCWIFREAEGEVPKVIERYRDEHYPKEGPVCQGYKKMAEWLVPLMKRFKLIKRIVRLIMTRPLTKYAKWYYGLNKYGWVFKPLGDFWVKIWRVGGIKQQEMGRWIKDGMRSVEA